MMSLLELETVRSLKICYSYTVLIKKTNSVLEFIFNLDFDSSYHEFQH